MNVTPLEILDPVHSAGRGNLHIAGGGCKMSRLTPLSHSRFDNAQSSSLSFFRMTRVIL